MITIELNEGVRQFSIPGWWTQIPAIVGALIFLLSEFGDIRAELRRWLGLVSVLCYFTSGVLTCLLCWLTILSQSPSGYIILSLGLGEFIALVYVFHVATDATAPRFHVTQA